MKSSAHKKKKTVILTYGTYDLLHIGHLNLLKRAKALGDYLVVGLSTESFNILKHKDCFLPFAHRMATLKALRYVDKVIPEESWEQKIGDVKKYKVDIFVMGDDWSGKFDELKKYCKVVYLPRTENLSTTALKTDILKKNGLKTPRK